MSTGLDVAAAAAQIASVAERVIKRLLPWLREAEDFGGAVRSLYDELRAFCTVVHAAERRFGGRSILGERTLGPREMQSLGQVMSGARSCVRRLSEGIPERSGQNPAWLEQSKAQIELFVKDGTIAREYRNVASARRTVALWISIARLEESRGQNPERGKRRTEALHQLENLSDGIRSLESLREKPVPSPDGGQNGDAGQGSREEEETEVMRVARKAQSYFESKTKNGSVPNARADKEESSKPQEEKDAKHDAGAWQTDKFFQDAIARATQEVYYHRDSLRYNEAAAAQYELIGYMRQRQRQHNVDFHDEADQLAVLAQFHVARGKHGDAADVYDRLLVVSDGSPKELAQLRFNLADARLKNDELESATAHANEANIILGEQEPDPSDDLTLKVLQLLARIYAKRGRALEAEMFAAQAMALRLLRREELDSQLSLLIELDRPPEEVLDRIREVEAEDDDGLTALMAFQEAIMNEEDTIARALLKAYPAIQSDLDVPNAVGETPLISATGCERADTVRWLLKIGADVHSRVTLASSQVTPVMIATIRQSRAILGILLAAGADPRDKDYFGWSVLHHAVSIRCASPEAVRDRASIVRALIETGGVGALRAKCNASKTALHVAAGRGHRDLVELLVHSGADVEAKDKSGVTPLLDAIDKGKPEVVRVLLELGADPLATDSLGRTPEAAANQPVGGADRMRGLIKKAIKDKKRSSGRHFGWMRMRAGKAAAPESPQAEEPTSHPPEERPKSKPSAQRPPITSEDSSETAVTLATAASMATMTTIAVSPVDKHGGDALRAEPKHPPGEHDAGNAAAGWSAVLPQRPAVDASGAAPAQLQLHVTAADAPQSPEAYSPPASPDRRRQPHSDAPKQPGLGGKLPLQMPAVLAVGLSEEQIAKRPNSKIKTWRRNVRDHIFRNIS